MIVAPVVASAPPHGRRRWLAAPTRFGITRGELLLYALLVALAAVLRFVDLGSRALHHDESIHAKEVFDMLRGKQYKYDPAYHGPLLYFSFAPLFWAFGPSDGLARVTPALFGSASVAALWLYRHALGRVGTPLAMAVLATSVAFLYYSRSLRHDAFLTFFLIVLGGAVVRYLAEPRRRWLILAWVALAFAFVTKEDTYIHGSIVVIVLVVFGGVAWRARRGAPELQAPAVRQIRGAFRALRADLDGIVYGLLAFLAIVFVLMTSFLTNLPGFRDGFVKAIEYWRGVHASERVNQPWFYYGMFLLVYEPFILVFGAAALARLRRAESTFPYVMAIWAVVGLSVYSVAGEKAAWLILPAAWPLLLLACWWAGRALSTPHPRWRRGLVATLTVLLLAWTLRYGIPLNYQHSDTPIDLVIYVQTAPDVLAATAVVDEAVRRSGQGPAANLHVENEYAWPFAWYLRGYTQVSYGTVEPERIADAPALIISPTTADRIGIQLTGYVGRRMKLRWWFPEFAYKELDWGVFGKLLGDPEAQRTFFAWLLEREKTSLPLDSVDFILYVRTDLLQSGPIGPFALGPAG
ncbi:MAG: TIGR03663 family protein [Actinobacteria bacterium]|nr:TIGR03663 family protein [Actinomycetota bacterium]